ncbi:MAG: transposase [Gammaproteobacteria bacterium]|nr:transposase [Gammaproteobacteria bacterium]
MGKVHMHPTLSARGLLKTVRSSFSQIEDNRKRPEISLSDHLMSGLAVFGLKYPSLLDFDGDRVDPVVASNLRNLYGIERVPCDTSLRECLDEVSPNDLRQAFKQLFAQLQRGKGLEGMSYLDGHYLLSIDGTGYYSSKTVHCPQCCEKHHRNGEITYYHQLLGAVLVHPDQSEVFPLAPEAMIRQDGARKNDCERNAAKRLLSYVRREHPHLKLLVVEDALASNGPHIKQLQSLNMRFILGAKQSDHGLLFDWVDHSRETDTYECIDDKGVVHRFRYLNGAPLNDANFELEINFLEYWETKPGGKTQHFSWVSDIPLNTDNVMKIMRAGRARWKIENETFNTLKNQGYHFEHNFGHGNKHLATVFSHLMMLAFLVDQIQQRCCQLFKLALKVAERKRYFWRKIRQMFDGFQIDSWEALLSAIAYGYERRAPEVLNTS